MNETLTLCIISNCFYFTTIYLFAVTANFPSVLIEVLNNCIKCHHICHRSILMEGFHSPLQDTLSSCPASACPAWVLRGSLAGASVGREGRSGSCLGLEFGSCPWGGRSCWGSWATPCWPDSCLREGLAGP
jgi:hypothetical protein